MLTLHQLDAIVALGIIEPVPPGHPTTWCLSMIIVPKKDKTPRQTVDLQALNKATKRETHHTQSLFNIISSIPPNKKKTVLDAWNWYHSILSHQRQETQPASLRNGDVDATYSHRKALTHQEMATPNVLTILPKISPEYRCIDSIFWDDYTARSFWHCIECIELCKKNGILFVYTRWRPPQQRIASNRLGCGLNKPTCPRSTSVTITEQILLSFLSIRLREVMY